MNDRFVLDTNVFVYSFDRSAAAKMRPAVQLIRHAVATRKGVISFQVVQEFFNVALRRFEPLMIIPEAEQHLATVLRPLPIGALLAGSLWTSAAVARATPPVLV
jgi:predicted nucleic acid-binding protein